MMDHPAEAEAAAYELLEALRWGGPPTRCPHCAAEDRCYFIRPADGVARRTRTGAATARRLWKCGACRRQFSVLTGTVLQGTRIPLATWVAAAWAPATRSPRMAAVFAAAKGAAPERGDDMLAAVLAIDPVRAQRLREGARRRRPRPQVGPTADYGGR